jgi:hypothetical protein
MTFDPEALENPAELKEAQKSLEELIKGVADEIIPVKIGHKGIKTHSELDNVYYSKKYDFWFCPLGKVDGTGEDQRYWNAFGLGRPKTNSSVSPTLEINIPVMGINHRISGVFAKDNGSIFLFHRGKLGGGRPGIGKRNFDDYYTEGKASVFEGKEYSDSIYLIGSLKSSDFLEQIKKFIEAVDQFKNPKKT